MRSGAMLREEAEAFGVSGARREDRGVEKELREWEQWRDLVDSIEDGKSEPNQSSSSSATGDALDEYAAEMQAATEKRAAKAKAAAAAAQEVRDYVRQEAPGLDAAAVDAIVHCTQCVAPAAWQSSRSWTWRR